MDTAHRGTDTRVIRAQKKSLLAITETSSNESLSSLIVEIKVDQVKQVWISHWSEPEQLDWSGWKSAELKVFLPDLY